MKLQPAFLLPLLFVTLLSAQVGVPRLGTVRFADGSVRAVTGLPANLIVAAKPLTSADFASFSDSVGLVFKDGLIRLIDATGVTLGERATSETKPLLNVDGDASTAIAWLPAEHALLRWDGRALAAGAIDDSALTGQVTYAQMMSQNYARLLVSNSAGSVSAVTVSLDTGAVVSSDILPGARGRVFIQHSFLVFQDADGLAVESVDGLRRNISLSKSLPPADLDIERMASDWLHVSSASSGQQWAVYLNQSNLHVSVLPPPPPAPKLPAVLDTATRGAGK
jgi:hypothetical protein